MRNDDPLCILKEISFDHLGIGVGEISDGIVSRCILFQRAEKLIEIGHITGDQRSHAYHEENRERNIEHVRGHLKKRNITINFALESRTWLLSSKDENYLHVQTKQQDDDDDEEEKKRQFDIQGREERVKVYIDKKIWVIILGVFSR